MIERVTLGKATKIPEQAYAILSMLNFPKTNASQHPYYVTKIA